MSADRLPLSVITTHDASSPEAQAQTLKLLDAGIWLYMRLLRAALKSDKAVMAFLEDVGPDIIAHYGRDRLIAMSWGCDRPGPAEFARIAKR